MNVLIMNKDHYLAMTESAKLEVVRMCHLVALHDVVSDTFNIVKNWSGEKGIGVSTLKMKEILRETEAAINPRLF